MNAQGGRDFIVCRDRGTDAVCPVLNGANGFFPYLHQIICEREGIALSKNTNPGMSRALARREARAAYLFLLPSLFFFLTFVI